MLRTGANKNVFCVYSVLILFVIFAGSCKSPAAAPADPSQTHTGGGVTVKITYLNPKGVDGPRFHVILETHSVNLDGYDLKSLSVLRDGNGKTYLPIKVESKGGGHHRQVTLSFPDLSDRTKSLDLVIQNVAGVPERVFHWDL